MLDWILLGLSVPLIGAGFLLRRRKMRKLFRFFATVPIVIGAFLFLTRILSIIFGPHKHEELKFSLWPERVQVFGFSLSYTIIYTWIAMALLIPAQLSFV